MEYMIKIKIVIDFSSLKTSQPFKNKTVFQNCYILKKLPFQAIFYKSNENNCIMYY